MKKSIVSGIVVSILTLASAAPGWGYDEKKIDSLVDKLQKKGVLTEEEVKEFKTTDKASSIVDVTAGKNGFVLKSADGNFKLQISANFNGDARFFMDRDRDGRNTEPMDQFYVRRMQMAFQGTLYKYFDFIAMPEFGGNQSRILDAYLSINYLPEFKIQAGKFKAPIGLEMLQSDRRGLFNERSMVTGMVPDRDTGIMLHGDLANKTVSYAIAIMNDAPDGVIGDVDSNDDKSYDGRIFLTPFSNTDLVCLKGLGFGISASYSDTKGTSGAPDLPSYKSPGRENIFTYRTNGAKTVAAGVHRRISPQAYCYHGPFGIMGEYILSSQEVSFGASKAKLNNSAWQVTTGYILTGENATYGDAIEPINPWGAVQLVGRYQTMDIDNDAFPVFADPAASVSRAKAAALGINWYLNKNVRIMLSYEQTKFDGGSVADTNREDEKVVFNRFQYQF